MNSYLDSTIPSQFGQVPDSVPEEVLEKMARAPLPEHIQAILDMPAQVEQNHADWLQTQKGR